MHKIISVHPARWFGDEKRCMLPYWPQSFLSSKHGLHGRLQGASISPLYFVNFAHGISVPGITMLLALPPLTLIFTSIRPSERATPMFLVMLVLAIVPATVGKRELALPMHLVAFPLTTVLAAVSASSPYVCSYAVDAVVNEFALIHGTLCPC